MICSFAAFFTDSFKIEREIFHVTELSCYRNRTGERILTPSILPLQLEAPCAWGGKSLGGSVSPEEWQPWDWAGQAGKAGKWDAVRL